MCCTSCLESLCCQDDVWLTVSWDHNQISSRRLLNHENHKSNSNCLIIRINHRSFPSVCIGEYHGTVLELPITAESISNVT